MSRAIATLALLACAHAAHAAHAQDHGDHRHHPPSVSRQVPVEDAPAPKTDPDATYRPPALTDADRAAAFPDLHGHDMRGHMDDDPFVWMVMADRLERQDGRHADALKWEAHAWMGHDTGRLWLKTEGERERGHAAEASLELLWGKPLDAWWDLQAGVRHDLAEHGDRSWLGVGFSGMAPYKFEVSAMAYLGEHGQARLDAEVEYELLLTNRLILQPSIEATAYARNERERGVGAGLADIEAGLRLRYEIRREFAPYIGVERAWRFGNTADFARNAGAAVRDTHWVIGIRAWL